MTEHVEATAYLVLEGKRSRYNDQRVTSCKIVKSTQGRPAMLSANEIALKVTVRVPAAAFDPLKPEAVIEVGEDVLLKADPITVEAVDQR